MLFSGVANRNEFTSDYSLLAINNFYMPIWRKKTCFLPGVACPCDDPRYSCILRVYIADALNKLDHFMFKKKPKISHNI